jgi:predicted TIM-barrel fold metal-dependent hydrolase
VELFDAHVRLGDSLYGYSLHMAELIEQMAALDIGRAVLCPVRPRSGGVAEANDLVASAVSKDPTRFVGFARVDPWHGPAARAELERGILQLGLRGVLLDPWEEHFVVSAAFVDPIVERAGELSVPVLVAGGYPNFSHPSQIGALASRHPGVQFIATHGGQINISGLLLGDARAMLAGHPNVSIETSGIYRLDFIEDTVAEFGAGRVFFGSGAPVFDQRLETLRIRLAHVSEDVKVAVGGQNLAELLGRTAL